MTAVATATVSSEATDPTAGEKLLLFVDRDHASADTAIAPTLPRTRPLAIEARGQGYSTDIDRRYSYCTRATLPAKSPTSRSDNAEALRRYMNAQPEGMQMETLPYSCVQVRDVDRSPSSRRSTTAVAVLRFPLDTPTPASKRWVLEPISHRPPHVGLQQQHGPRSLGKP